MTDREAHLEAQRRWGKNGACWHPYYGKRGDASYCRVGLADSDILDERTVYGRGEDWERAFADADARKR